jgi:hypothetical protein
MLNGRTPSRPQRACRPVLTPVAEWAVQVPASTIPNPLPKRAALSRLLFSSHSAVEARRFGACRYASSRGSHHAQPCGRQPRPTFSTRWSQPSSSSTGAVVDDCSHQCLALISFPSRAFGWAANADRGKPKMIVSGTELTSNAILQWADDHRSPGTASHRASRVQNTSAELRAIPRCSFTEVAWISCKLGFFRTRSQCRESASPAVRLEHQKGWTRLGSAASTASSASD